MIVCLLPLNDVVFLKIPNLVLGLKTRTDDINHQSAAIVHQTVRSHIAQFNAGLTLIFMQMPDHNWKIIWKTHNHTYKGSSFKNIILIKIWL